VLGGRAIVISEKTRLATDDANFITNLHPPVDDGAVA